MEDTGAFMNICILTGHLGADPESKYTQDNLHIVELSLAFKFGKNKTGWIRVTCFDKLADSAVKYLHKGAKIGLAAELQQDKWENEIGEKRTAIKLVARNLEFIKTDGRGFENSTGEQTPGTDDDIPF